jgi:hypothetical protein
MNLPGDLPNLEGFKFVGINHDYKRGNCYVTTNKRGMYTVKGDFGWMDLIGWENARPEIMEASAQPLINIGCNSGQGQIL